MRAKCTGNGPHNSGLATLFACEDGFEIPCRTRSWRRWWIILSSYTSLQFLSGGTYRMTLAFSGNREEHSMDQYRSRLKLSESFERHWSIRISGEIHIDQSLVHIFFWGNSYGPMVLRVFLKFPPTLALVHGWLFPGKVHFTLRKHTKGFNTDVYPNDLFT